VPVEHDFAIDDLSEQPLAFGGLFALVSDVAADTLPGLRPPAPCYRRTGRSLIVVFSVIVLSFFPAASPPAEVAGSPPPVPSDVIAFARSALFSCAF
jgi:hypothetical protein